jgi:hypothetical protein
VYWEAALDRPHTAAGESPTFGVIAGVNPTEVQWKGLNLGVFPSVSLIYGVVSFGCWLVMLHSDKVAKPFQSLLFNKFKTWQDPDGISNVSVSHSIITIILFRG